jgi:hypothetical protein
VNPVEFREEIGRLWNEAFIRPPFVGEIHPGGPGRLWVSISLREPRRPIAWLHFRMPAAHMEYATAVGVVGFETLQWREVTWDAVPGILETFAEKTACHDRNGQAAEGVGKVVPDPARSSWGATPAAG